MANIATLDRAFYTIMQRFINTGQAPHYTELAADLGLSAEEGRRALHDPVDTGLHASWLHPDTDLLISFPPVHNLPNQYRITVDVSRSGLPGEVSSRWRFAGCFQTRRYE